MDCTSNRKRSRFERKKEATKEKIVESAIKLFTQQGFAVTTMEQIAELADIAKGTLYNHFPSKEAIVGEYVHMEIQLKGIDALDSLYEFPDTATRLSKVLLKSLEWAQSGNNRELYEIYVTYRMQNIIQTARHNANRSGFSIIMAKIMELGQDAGEIRQDLPAWVLGHQMEALHTFAVIAWLADPDKYSIEVMIKTNIEVFLSGAIKILE